MIHQSRYLVLEGGNETELSFEPLGAGGLSLKGGDSLDLGLQGYILLLKGGHLLLEKGVLPLNNGQGGRARIQNREQGQLLLEDGQLLLEGGDLLLKNGIDRCLLIKGGQSGIV